MRNLTFTFCLLVASISFSQTPFIKNLGKGINQPVECSCVDKNGDLTVGYYESPLKESLVFDKWNIALNQWNRGIYMLQSARMPARNYTKCIYKNDSLIVFTAYKETGINKSALFYLPPGAKPEKINELKSVKNGEVYVSDLKIIKKNLIVYGRFDSIINPLKPKESVEIVNVAYYNGEKWRNAGMNLQFKNFSVLNTPVASNGESSLIISNDNLIILKYTFPGKWEYARKASQNKIPFTGVFYIDNKWILTKLNLDSVYYSSNSFEFFARKIDRPLGLQLRMINTPKGILIAEDNKEISRVLKLDTVLNKLSPLYFSPNVSGEVPKSSLIYSNLKIFYTSTLPIVFKDTKFDNLVELNLDLDRTIKLNLITAILYYDKNNNYKKDVGEDFVSGKIHNRTFNYAITSLTGKFEDHIPNYTDAEYELISYDNAECLKLPFSGFLKTNTISGTNDPLNFPLQRSRISKNINVKSYGRPCARLLDTIPLSIKITGRDCNLTPANASVTLFLDSNTILVDSKPNYTSKNKNTFIYNLLNVSTTRDSIIQLNVLYSNTKYKIDDYAKHYVQLSGVSKEDTIDNSDSIIQKMVYSYDPNAKYSIPQGKIVSDLKSIRYYIEFQNEGNDIARRVTVLDTLDTHIPVYEFQMIAASHPYSVSLKNNVVTWVFDNINLPPKSFDADGSQGYLIFDAKIISNINVGDSIKNRAFIFFDYNEPIVTNLSIIKRTEDLPVVYGAENSLWIYPNPANSTVTIENKINIIQEVKIFNMVGQEVINVEIGPIGKNIQSISSWPRGMYFIRTGKGKYQKFLVH